MKIKKLTSISMIAGMLIALSGCSLISEAESLKPYAPSDGVNLSVEALKARNVLLIQGTSGNAVLIGSFINSSQDDIQASIQATDSEGQDKVAAFLVKAGEKFDIGYNGTEGIVLALNVTPGSLYSVYLSTGVDPIKLMVPVLDGSLAEYREYAEALK